MSEQNSFLCMLIKVNLKKKSRAWWHRPSVPTLKRQRQSDLCEFQASSEFQSYIVRPNPNIYHCKICIIAIGSTSTPPLHPPFLSYMNWVYSSPYSNTPNVQGQSKLLGVATGNCLWSWQWGAYKEGSFKLSVVLKIHPLLLMLASRTILKKKNGK